MSKWPLPQSVIDRFQLITLMFFAVALFILSSMAMADNLSEGVKHYQQGDYAKAHEYLLKAAKEGNPQAQQALGTLYTEGMGIKRDLAEAAKWNTRAAEQGDMAAQYNLALQYQNGWGVKQDYQQARKWYEKSASQGFVNAWVNLALLYSSGLGVSQDYSKAAGYLEKAAEKITRQLSLILHYCTIRVI